MYAPDNKSNSNPKIIHMLAMTLAALAEPISDYLQHIKDPSGIFNQLPVPDLKVWLEMYRKPSRLKKMNRAMIVNLQEAEKMAKEFQNNILAGVKELNITDEQMNEIKEGLDKIGFDVLSNMDEVNKKKYKSLPKKLHAELDRTKKEYMFSLGDVTTEQIFFIKVFMPCFLMYKTYPIKLFRKARLGDIDALEKLVRLDDSIILDKRISKIYHSSSTKRSVKERLNNSLASGPKEKVDRKKVKMSLGGLISFYSEKLGKRINEREIRHCFDEIAKQKGNGDIDVDIPESPEAFAKAIQRERKELEDLL